MAATEFRLIGSMQLRVGDVDVPLPRAAERGLLAVLLLSPGRTVAPASLIDRLWSEATLPADPLNALQVRVSKLRRGLAAGGLDVISRDAAGYRADVEPDSVDVHRFGSLIRAAREASRSGAGTATALVHYDEALALWRGDPLADFAGEAWATVEAARLHQLHLAALTERAETALALGRHAEVAGDLEPLVHDDPKHEALAGLLMTALYRSGRQADALQVYDRTRRSLDDELGLQPSAALQSLHQRVLQQDSSLDAPAAPEPPAVSSAAGTGPAAATGIAGESRAARVRTRAFARPRLIGRDSEAASIRELLARERVVTLVGPGGAGKTSLALVAAHDVLSDYDGQVHLARLAATTEAEAVPLAVADAVGVPLDGADPNAEVRDRLLSYLSSRRLLLVLDNCEHLVDEVAALVDDIARTASEVTVLATSREALAVPGEVQFAVSPLDVPPAGTPPHAVLDYAAPRLFVERARAVRAGLELSDPELVALAEVCTRLDGMPLALELAAARMSSLSLMDLADRLSDSLGLLTTGPRTAETRQRTLRATVEWSHALLPAAEQTVFRRLAVFHGGWTLSAAEAVAAGGDIGTADVLDLLDHLVNRSMVVVETGSRARYRMLETLRQFAAEELTRSGEGEEAAARHAAFFRGLADEAELSLRGPGQRETLQRLREEHPNLRAALAWLAAAPDRIEDGLHLGGALGLYWHLGRHVEGRDILRRLVEVPGGSRRARARALQSVSIVERPRACLVHPSPRCAETAAESLELFLAEGDASRAALSRVLLAVELLDGSAPEQLDQLLAEAGAQFAADGDEWGQAVIAFVRLQSFLRRGDEERARAIGRTAVDAFRALDDPWGLSAVLYHWGWGLKEFGRYAEAVAVLEQAIDVSRDAGLFNTTQWALADLGLALLCLGQTDAARESFDRAAAASEEVGDAAGQILAEYGYAVLAQMAGDAAGARSQFLSAANGLQQLRTPLPTGHALAGVAWCDVQLGELEAAADRSAEVRRMGETAGEPTLVAAGLEGLARVAVARGQLADGVQLAAEAAAVRSAAARPLPPYERVGLPVAPESDVGSTAGPTLHLHVTDGSLTSTGAGPTS